MPWSSLAHDQLQTWRQQRLLVQWSQGILCPHRSPVTCMYIIICIAMKLAHWEVRMDHFIKDRHYSASNCYDYGCVYGKYNKQHNILELLHAHQLQSCREQNGHSWMPLVWWWGTLWTAENLLTVCVRSPADEICSEVWAGHRGTLWNTES